MAEPTSRIEPASSYREPDTKTPPGKARDKQKPKAKSFSGLPEPSEPDELDDFEKHSLDTLA